MTLDPHARQLYDLAQSLGSETIRDIVRDETGRIAGSLERRVDPAAIALQAARILDELPPAVDTLSRLQRLDSIAAFARASAARQTDPTQRRRDRAVAASAEHQIEVLTGEEESA